MYHEAFKGFIRSLLFIGYYDIRYALIALHAIIYYLLLVCMFLVNVILSRDISVTDNVLTLCKAACAPVCACRFI